MKMFSSRTGEGVRLELSWLMVGLVFIFFFTSLNGLFDSIDSECGYTEFWQCTFLGEPADLHADLIKAPLSLTSERPSDLEDWSRHYQAFYLHNAYGKMQDVFAGKVTVYGVTPLTLLVSTALMQGILTMGPLFVVTLFYLAAATSLWCLCWYFVAGPWERVFAFVILALSYPFMIMLTRANIGALIVGFSLILYIYLACNRRQLVLAALCLAVACNIRPNAILLAPLLLCFGVRKGIGASFLFLAMTGVIASICYFSAEAIYPGYSLQIFFKAVENYERLYVIGPFGNGNNNSAYGAVKLIEGMLLMKMYADELRNYNAIILCISAVMISYATYRFWRGRLPAYYFAFVLTCLYILASAVFATYHLIVLFVFVLAAGSKTSETGPFPVLLLFMTSLVLIPKNYFYPFPNVSFEVILNPVILAACVIWVLCLKFPVPEEATAMSQNSLGKLSKKQRRHA